MTHFCVAGLFFQHLDPIISDGIEMLEKNPATHC